MKAAMPAVIGCLLAGTVAGYLLHGALYRAPDFDRKAVYDAAYQEGYARAEEDINQVFVKRGESSPLTQSVLSVYGTVKEVGSDSLTIEYDESQVNIIKSGLVIKTVRLAAGGMINKMVEDTSADPDDATVTREPSASLSSGFGPESVPPSFKGESSGPLLQKAVPVQIKDVHIGDYVHVIAVSDIRAADTIEAMEVRIFDVKPPEGEAIDPSKMPFSRTIDQGGMPDQTAPSGPAPSQTGMPTPPPPGVPN